MPNSFPTLPTACLRALLSACLLLGLRLPVLAQAAATLPQHPAHWIIAGKIVDQGTGQAIAYASIGVVGEIPGTVCGEDGAFSFTIPASLAHKTVRCSALGYQSQEWKVTELLAALAGQRAFRIALAQKSVQLMEVQVGARKWKSKKLGSYVGPVAMVHHNFTIPSLRIAENLGNEMGIYIASGRQPSYIQQLAFYLSNNPYDMVKFRVNVYAVKAGVPFENLAPGNIFVVVPNKQKGWIEVDLAPYNIYLEQDFVIALEWVDCLPKTKSLPLTIPGIVPGLHTIYHKDTSQGNWKKMPPMGMGMNVVIKRER